MSIAWYLAVSAIVFALGAFGVMTRRNPLVVLLCLELMLNGGNLALIAFARMWGNGDGQILALVVMTGLRGATARRWFVVPMAAVIHLLWIGFVGTDPIATLPIGEGIELSSLWLATVISLVSAVAIFRTV